MRPDQGGLGDHICNCGYVVAEQARGRGYAVEMCLQSQCEASRRGFTGVKFNLVATNEAAVLAWQSRHADHWHDAQIVPARAPRSRR
jgi:hypothetical protein